MGLAQKYTQRPREQNGSSDINPQSHAQLIFCKTSKNIKKGKGQSVQQMVLGKLDSYARKNEIRLLSYTRWTNKLNTVSRPQCET